MLPIKSNNFLYPVPSYKTPDLDKNTALQLRIGAYSYMTCLRYYKNDELFCR